MKTLNTLFALIALVFSQVLVAQQFEDTQDYRLVMETAYDKEMPEEGTMYLTAFQDPSQKLVPFEIYLESFEQATVTVLKNPKLAGVKEIIKVEVEYIACSSYIEKHYFLVKDNGFWTALPPVHTAFYEGPIEYNDYIFPTQQFGRVGQVVKANFKLDQNFAVETIVIQQSFSFIDDQSPSEGITATFK